MDLLRVGLDRVRSCFGLGEGKDGGVLWKEGRN